MRGRRPVLPRGRGSFRPPARTAIAGARRPAPVPNARRCGVRGRLRGAYGQRPFAPEAPRGRVPPDRPVPAGGGILLRLRTGSVVVRWFRRVPPSGARG